MATKTKTPICEFHAKMQCKFTDGSCRNDHALVDAARGAGICTFNLVGACSHSPCKYRHEPVSAVSKLLAKSGGGGGSLVVKGGEKAIDHGKHATALIEKAMHKVPGGFAITKHHSVSGGGGGAVFAGTTTTTTTVTTTTHMGGGGGAGFKSGGGGGKKVFDVVFSFDTTGSMYPYLDSVKGTIKSIVDDLHTRLRKPSGGGSGGGDGDDDAKKIIRIGCLAHGDYCDAKSSYVIKWHDLTTKGDDIKSFVSGCGPTGGGDADECYELALHAAGAKFSWDSKAQFKCVVLIGDSNPHDKDYPLNKHKYDWREEARKLASRGITVFPVHCGGHSSSKAFYEEVAKITGGKYIALSDAGSVGQLIAGLCLKAASKRAFTAYSEDLRRSGARNEALFSQLTTITITKTKMVAIKAGGGGAGIGGPFGGGGGAGKLLLDRRA